MKLNCLEWDEFLLDAPTWQATRHRDRKVLCAGPRSSPEPAWVEVCHLLKTRLNLEFPHYHDSSHRPATHLLQWKPYCISSPMSQCRTNVDHFKKQNPRIIHPLRPNRDSLKTPMLRMCPQFPLYTLLIICSQAFVEVLSDSLSNLIPTTVLSRYQ